MVKDVKEKGLEPYEAPKMMVYEMEIEQCVLLSVSGRTNPTFEGVGEDYNDIEV